MKSGTSRAEQFLFQHLKSYFFKKYKVVNGDRKIIFPLEIDIVIEGKNTKIAIEYNGPIHFKMTYGKTLKTQSKKFFAILKRDLLKEGKLKSLGWKFIIVKDKEKYDEDFLNYVLKKIIKLVNDLEKKKINFDKIVIEREDEKDG